MAFDIGNGLSQAGTAVAATAGTYALEQQKADLENQKLVLADQLAGAQAEKGRQFQTSERLSTQSFQSGENTATRTNQLAVAQVGADAAVKAAGIHAGAEITAAQIGASTSTANTLATIKAQSDNLDKTLSANKPLLDADVAAKTIANTNAQQLQSAKDAVAAARNSDDPVALKAAQQKVYDAEYSSQSQVQQVSLYQAQAKITESALTAAQTRLQAVTTGPMGMMPQSQALAAQLQAQVARLQTDYQTAVRQAAEAIKSLPAYNPPGVAAAGAPPLSSFQKPPAGQATPAGSPPAAAPPPGLVNQAPPPGP